MQTARRTPFCSVWLLALLVLFVLTAFAAPVARASPVEVVAASAIQAQVADSKGLVVVNISSTDPRCGYCIQANAKFEKLARRSDVEGRFLQVAWQPWSPFPVEIGPFLKRFGISGLPARLTFQDGQFAAKVLGVPPDMPPESPQKVTGDIPLVAPQQIAEKTRTTKGILVVQLTSFETACSFCMRSNPVFEALAKGPVDPQVQFVRVAYAPWTLVGSDAFAKAFGNGGLPIFLTFQDGRLVRKNLGIADLPELRKTLLDGVQ